MHNKKTASAIKVEKIARTAHETIRGWRLANGQDGIPEWDDAPDWMVAVTKESVVSVLQEPDMSPLKQHEQWMARSFVMAGDSDLRKTPNKRPTRF